MAEEESRSRSQQLTLPGYVLDDEALERVDVVSRRLVQPLAPGKTLETVVVATCAGGAEIDVDDVASLLTHAREEEIEIQSVDLLYTQEPDGTALGVSFALGGRVAIGAFGESRELNLELDRLQRTIEACAPRYSWPVRNLIFGTRPRKLLSSLMGVLLLIVFVSTSYYGLASWIGVDINPNMIPSYGSYPAEVSQALVSNSLQEKLDVLLRGELVGFDNASDIKAFTSTVNKLLIVCIVAVGLCLFAFRQVGKLYPLSLFALGLQQRRVRRLEKQRELWGAGIILALLVNLAGGVLVAFFD